ncbi:MAG: transposase [Pirellulales bacterium]
MSHTYTSSLFHCVFSTKDRRPAIRPEFQSDLWAYLGGIARANRLKALAVGGVEDHVHLLISLPADIPLSRGLQLLKGGSSRWVHETVGRDDFRWQQGYGGFSVGVSQVDATVAYIASQAEHHRCKTFQEEFLEILHDMGSITTRGTYGAEFSMRAAGTHSAVPIDERPHVETWGYFRVVPTAR